MLYRVTGTNHGTGARMTLDLEAESRAAAERKAANTGMDVLHVQESATDGAEAVIRHSSKRGQSSGAAGSAIKVIIILALVVAAAWYLMPKIRAMIGR